MYRLRTNAKRVVRIIFMDNERVIYFDPERRERNERGRAEFDRIFERMP